MKRKYTPKRRNTMPVGQRRWLEYVAALLSGATPTQGGVLLPLLKVKAGSVWEEIDFHFEPAEHLPSFARSLRAVARGKDAGVVFGQKPGSGRPRGPSQYERVVEYLRQRRDGLTVNAALRVAVRSCPHLPAVKPETLKRYVRAEQSKVRRGEEPPISLDPITPDDFDVIE